MPPKKVKLSPEEQIERKQQRKLEKRRKKIVRKRKLKHNYLEREIKLTEFTIKNHEKNWKHMLIRITIPRIREDLEFAWHNFERIIDCKDFAISVRLDDLDYAEEQHLRSIKGHLSNVDNIIRVFHAMLNDSQTDYKKTVKKLRYDARLHCDRIMQTYKQEEDSLKVMLYGLEQVRKENEKNIKGEFSSKLDETRGHQEEVVFRMAAFVEKGFQDLWVECQNVVDEYVKTTDERWEKYLSLNAQDAAAREINQKQTTKIMDMLNTTRKLQRRFHNMKTKRVCKINVLNDKKLFFKKGYTEIKDILAKLNQKFESSILNVCVSGNKNIDFLSKFKRKGEHILHIITICRKLETEEEKVKSTPLSQPCITEKKKKAVEEYSGRELEIFWNKVAKVSTMLAAFNQEMEHLREENTILKEEISNYCQCFECPALPPIANISENRVVIEGVNEVKKYIKFNP